MLKSSDSTGDRRCNCAGHGKTALLYGNVCVGVWVCGLALGPTWGLVFLLLQKESFEMINTHLFIYFTR